jgi:hypothetical protein
VNDISPAAAARFGLMLQAGLRNNVPLAAEMLLSIPAADLEAIKARFAEFGIKPQDLVATVIPGVVV